MYGNEKLPGVAVSEQFRYDNSIWQGYTQATWFKVVKVNGTDGAAIKAGTIMKEVSADGSYTPITAGDILSAISDLPGVRPLSLLTRAQRRGQLQLLTAKLFRRLQVSLSESQVSLTSQSCMLVIMHLLNSLMHSRLV